MEQKKDLGLLLAKRTGLPPEAVTGLPRLTVDGAGSVLIENHRGLLEYGGELIEVDGGRLRVRLRGDGMELKYLSGSELVIDGRIFSVEFI